MDISKLLDCGDVLSEMSAHFEAIQPVSNESAQAVAQLAITRLYVTELAEHLTGGMELEAAVLATARGELKIGE